MSTPITLSISAVLPHTGAGSLIDTKDYNVTEFRTEQFDIAQSGDVEIDLTAFSDSVDFLAVLASGPAKIQLADTGAQDLPCENFAVLTGGETAITYVKVLNVHTEAITVTVYIGKE